MRYTPTVDYVKAAMRYAAERKSYLAGDDNQREYNNSALVLMSAWGQFHGAYSTED